MPGMSSSSFKDNMDEDRNDDDCKYSVNCGFKEFAHNSSAKAFVASPTKELFSVYGGQTSMSTHNHELGSKLDGKFRGGNEKVHSLTFIQ